MLPTSVWSARFAAATPLPDRRLTSRLASLLTNLADKPLDAFPQATADWHQAKAIYRFLSNERFAWQDLLAGWNRLTAEALQGQRAVYVVHDTTTFCYNTLKHTTGLGSINHIEAVRGIHCHSSIAVQSDGVVLGLVHQHYWVRSERRKSPANSRPREDKESIKWQHGLNATAKVWAGIPASQRPRVIHLMDREGDIHEVFARVQELGHGAIIRRYRNRAVDEWPLDADQLIRTVPALAQMKWRRPAGHGRRARTAVVELRSKVMTLTPNNHVERRRGPLRLTMVQVREVGSPPAGEEPIDWMLWTTEPARTKRQIVALREPMLCAGGWRTSIWCGNRAAASNNSSWRHGTAWRKRWSCTPELPCASYVCVTGRDASRPRHAPKYSIRMNGGHYSPISQGPRRRRTQRCPRSNK